MRTAWLLPLLNTFAVFIVAPWSICTYARIYMPLASVNGLRSGEADGSRCTQAAKPSTIPACPQYRLSTQRMGCWPALSPFARPRCCLTETRGIFRKANQSAAKDNARPPFAFDADAPRLDAWHESRSPANHGRPRSRALRVTERIVPEAPRSGASSDSP